VKVEALLGLQRDVGVLGLDLVAEISLVYVRSDNFVDDRVLLTCRGAGSDGSLRTRLAGVYRR
jgi:hypothetical protein